MYNNKINCVGVLVICFFYGISSKPLNFTTTCIQNTTKNLGVSKDTPLIFVVGLMELAGMIGLAKTNPKWLGMAMEGYVFAGLVFWVICYAMSRYSQNLERKLSTER